MTPTDQQLYEQVEIGDVHLEVGDIAEINEDFAPVADREGGVNIAGSALYQDLEDQANGQEADGVDDLQDFYKDNNGVDGYAEDFNDPDFMKKQQEELERFQRMHQQNTKSANDQ